MHSLSVITLVTCVQTAILLRLRPPKRCVVVVDVDRDVVVVVDVDRDVVVVDGTTLLLCCRLQDQLEKQHLENMKVWQSLGETLNNLENHEIQLALAMQDLMVATSEIKKAAKIREQLNQLER